MVSLLNDEAQREAHNNYLSKMKKKAEQEKRQLKRKNKREAKMNAKVAQKRSSVLSRSGTEAGELDKVLGGTFGKNNMNMASSNVNDGTKTEKSDCEED